MIRQPQARQPDETICFNCGSTVKRDFDNCPNCGSRIAAGPLHTAAAPLQIRGRPASSYAAQAPSSGETGYHPATVGEDVVGAGRYIINFILAGIIGLILTYVLRRQGWLATWICIPIFIIVVFILASTR